MHDDDISAGIEDRPEKWWDEELQQEVAWPVVYVTGDAYLNPTQSRELAQRLLELADELEKGQ